MSASIPRLLPEESVLLVVDLQQRLIPAMFEAERLVKNCAILIRAAGLLGVPVIATEHNPAGLGATVPAIREVLGASPTFAKTLFSACTPQTNAALQRLAEDGRNSVLLCGLESHVCLLQTGLDLLDAGSTVFVPNNAVSSRYESDKAAGLSRLHAAGAVPSSTEMALFEWMRDANHPAFKQILQLVK